MSAGPPLLLPARAAGLATAWAVDLVPTRAVDLASAWAFELALARAADLVPARVERGRAGRRQA